jgi:hypothetical protein
MSEELNTEITELPFTEVEMVDEVETDAVESFDFTQDYSTVKINKGDTFFDENGNAIDPKSISVFERLKLFAKQMGQEVNDPNPKCKKCYGRGYTGINIDGDIPQPCNCIYKKFFAENPDWRGQSMPSWNRATKRNYQKRLGKYITLQADAMNKKYSAEEKSKANLGKNTPDFEERKALRLAAFQEAERLEALKHEIVPEIETEEVVAEIA